MAISTNVHPLFTYNFYPRAYYFRKRLPSLVERFHNILSVFPPDIRENDKIREIDQEVKTYEKPPRLVVHSNAELDLSDMVVSMAPLTDPLRRIRENGIDIIVIYIEIANADTEGVRIAENVIRTMKTEDTNNRSYNIKSDKGTIYSDRVFLWCKVKEEGVVNIPGLRQAFCRFLQSHFALDGPCKDQVIISSKEIPLKIRISNYLEKSIVTTFEKVQSYLDRFLTPMATRPVEGEIIEQTALQESIQAFVSNKWHITDVLNQRETEPDSDKTKTAGMQAEDRYLIYICEELANVAKCSISKPLSEKFRLPVSVCNDMMMADSSKEKFINALSLSTKSIMKRLFSFREHERDYEPPAKTEKHNYMVDRIRNDLSKPIKDIEKLMKLTRAQTLIMEKMKFEIKTYLKQSIMKEPEVQEIRPNSSLEMKKAVLGLDHVYGCGTVYGQFEIHLTQKDKGIEDVIRKVLQDHKYYEPYAVKVLEKIPIKFADMQHEHGKEIFIPDGNRRRRGTLGGFVEDEEKKELFAVTCAHVVRPGNHAGDLDVFVDERQQPRRLGVSTEELALCTAGAEIIIDMAAVKIVDEIRNQCIRFLKDEDGINRHTELVDYFELNEYLGKDVYKYGAATHLTQGIICSVDYHQKIRELLGSSTSAVVIEDLPGSLTKFADRGDSGAFVCLQNPEHEGPVIKALSVLTGGDMELVEDPAPKYMTFLLQRGLQEMVRKSGKRLSLCE